MAEANAWLDAYRGAPDESAGAWERMLGSGRNLRTGYDTDDLGEDRVDPFEGFAERDLILYHGGGSGHKIVVSVTSERPTATRALEDASGHLIETLRRCVRVGETPAADLAVDAALNQALCWIRGRARRPTVQALADALGCTRQTVSERVRRGRLQTLPLPREVDTHDEEAR